MTFTAATASSSGCWICAAITPNDKPARLITLGDYIDRGPDSFGVVRLIRHRLADEYPRFKSIINLKGNHEDMMVRAVPWR